MCVCDKYDEYNIWHWHVVLLAQIHSLTLTRVQHIKIILWFTAAAATVAVNTGGDALDIVIDL